jgi:protein-disulfide isomerase
MEETNQGEIKKTSNSSNFLPLSILIAAVLISGSIIYMVHSGKTTGNAPVNPKKQAAAINPSAISPAPELISDRDVILGDPKAPVSLIEYSDYQCPFCGRFFEQVESSLREEYIKPGKVKMVYRNFVFLGPESFAAAQAAECAKDQNKFWVYHDALFKAEAADGKENNGNLERGLFLKLAKELKLDTNSFAACLDGNKYAEKVRSETAEAQKAGINSTPTIFINDQLIRGAQPYSQFKTTIDNFLGAK